MNYWLRLYSLKKSPENRCQISSSLICQENSEKKSVFPIHWWLDLFPVQSLEDHLVSGWQRCPRLSLLSMGLSHWKHWGWVICLWCFPRQLRSICETSNNDHKHILMISQSNHKFTTSQWIIVLTRLWVNSDSTIPNSENREDYPVVIFHSDWFKHEKYTVDLRIKHWDFELPRNLCFSCIAKALNSLISQVLLEDHLPSGKLT